MKKTLPLIALLLLSSPLYAKEVSRCTVEEGGLVRELELDSESKSASVTDLFGKKYPAKIILTREHSAGKAKLNIFFEYTALPEKRYIELIVTPILGNVYRVGLAGYIDHNGERYLDLAANEEAKCS